MGVKSSLEAAQGSVSGAKAPGNRRFWWLLAFFLIFLVLAIGAILGAVLGAAKDDRTDDASANAPTSASRAQPEAGSAQPVDTTTPSAAQQAAQPDQPEVGSAQPVDTTTPSAAQQAAQPAPPDSGSSPPVDTAPSAAQLAATSSVASTPAMATVSLGPSDTWENLPNLPISMGEVTSGILTLAGKAYVVLIGEHPGAVSDAENGVTLLYDIAAGMWSQAAKRPGNWNHQAAEVFGNQVFVFGGLANDDIGGGQDTLQIGELVLDEEGNIDVEWQQGAPIPFGTGSAASGLFGDTVILCGGINPENTDTISTCATYSLLSDTWDATTPPAMPLGRNHAAACSDGEKFFVFGGRVGKNTVGEGFAETQIYTPGQGWSVGTPLPLARGGMGKAVFHDGKCYVFGGEVSDDEDADEVLKVEASLTVYSVDVYDTATDSWTQAEDMPKGLHGIFPVDLEGAVYITGGGVENSYSQSTQTWRYIL